MFVGRDGEPLDRRSFFVAIATATAGVAAGCQSGRSTHSVSDHELLQEEPLNQKAAGGRALDDPAIQHGMVSFKSVEVTVQGYLARPKARGQYRAVVVLHGDFGAPEAYRNLAADLARNSFVGLASKRFSRWPGLTLQDVINSDRTDNRFRSGSFNEQELQDAQAAIDYLEAQPFVKPGGVGVIGFCGGGYQALLLSTRSTDIRAVVAFYAPPEQTGQFQNPRDPKPSVMDRVDELRVPVQGHYGTDDPFVPLEPVRKLARALKARGTPVSVFTYEGATHGFYNHMQRHYDAEAAALARGRMLTFLKQQLK